MKYSKFTNLSKKIFIKPTEKSFSLEEFDDITDEIEKSLSGMKGFFDISEDEIDEAIKTRRKFRLLSRKS
tara:strand:+ start:492 stop:701 length:210 start_codon:yes stop_codon:yes gene_type:complete